MIFDSVSKSIKLRKISRILGAPGFLSDSVQDMVSGFDKKNETLDKLYSLSKNFKYANKRLEEYNIDREKFKEIYRKLVRAGAGQWVKRSLCGCFVFSFWVYSRVYP